jgi:hypothetical protein
MLLLLSSVKLVAEIALLALVGRWLLGVLAGARRETNIFWRVLDAMVQPFVRTIRAVTPRVVLDRHIPLAAFVALGMVWVVATLAKIEWCLEHGVALCR